MTAKELLTKLDAIEGTWADYDKEAIPLVECFRAEARAEALKEIPKVCGNCLHGKPTSLDDMRCYQDTPYTPTGLHCKACKKWEPCGVKENPRAAITQEPQPCD